MATEPFGVGRPIVTPEAKEFWLSKHKLNKVQAIVAFSEDQPNFYRNMRNYGYTHLFAGKVWRVFGSLVNNTTMQPGDGFILYDLSTPWYTVLTDNP